MWLWSGRPNIGPRYSKCLSVLCFAEGYGWSLKCQWHGIEWRSVCRIYSELCVGLPSSRSGPLMSPTLLLRVKNNSFTCKYFPVLALRLQTLSVVLWRNYCSFQLHSSEILSAYNTYTCNHSLYTLGPWVRTQRNFVIIYLNNSVAVLLRLMVRKSKGLIYVEIPQLKEINLGIIETRWSEFVGVSINLPHI